MLKKFLAEKSIFVLFPLLSFVSLPTYAKPNINLILAHPPYHLLSKGPADQPSGLFPAQVRKAYGFDQVSLQGEGQVIGIVDAFDAPTIETDFDTFNSTFGLPACTTANGCFIKVYASGSKPQANDNWAVEASLDVEWAHAIAPHAKILFVEAEDNSLGALLTAIRVAVQKGANEISMSWGGNEFSSETEYDQVFNVSGVTFVASSGDAGTGIIFPSVSPYVVSVGGTNLKTDSSGKYISEIGWSGSGGGISKYESQPDYQRNFSIPNNTDKRGVPDVAYNASGIGFAVYNKGWIRVGGTSAGAPQWAALIAIAKSAANNLEISNNNLYNAAKQNLNLNYHDIIKGSNGSCGTICKTLVGYDYVTGIGTPKANTIIEFLSGNGIA